MTREELIKDYPVLGDNSFKFCLNTILSLDGDGLTSDRGRIIDYCDVQSDNDDDMFFWEMLCAVKFINEGATAYTTPDKIIALNYPCEDIIKQDKERFRKWYFVYCHECLHQLWDTFEVGKEIETNTGKKYNHDLLNIASDVVINDFLEHISPSGKLTPDNIYDADTLKDKCGVEYDRKIDTQYSLYLKLDALSDEDKEKLLGAPENSIWDHIEPPQGGGGGGGSNGKQGGNNGGDGDSDDKEKSSDYISGWNKALSDYAAGKIKL